MTKNNFYHDLTSVYLKPVNTPPLGRITALPIILSVAPEDDSIPGLQCGEVGGGDVASDRDVLGQVRCREIEGEKEEDKVPKHISLRAMKRRH